MLPVEGTPLLFSTNLGYDFALHVWGKSGKSFDLPAHADAVHGGFVVDTHSLQKEDGLAPDISGTLRGYWGFDVFDGPTFHLQSSHPARWTIGDRRQERAHRGP